MSTSSSSSGSASSTFSRASAHALSYYSSSSSRSSPFSGNYMVDGDGFLYSDHRAGGPYLCSLPDEFCPFGKEWLDQNRFPARHQHIYDTVRSILGKHHVQYRDLSITGRKSRVDPEPQPIPTHSPLSVSVDIMDTLLATPCRSFPVARTDSIFGRWNDIVPAILDALDSREWVALGCWRYGVSDTATENPVTVVVSVEKRSMSGWSTAIRRIEMILRGFDVTDVDILFQKDEICRHVENPDLPQAACTKFAQPGISLGIHSSTAGSSTLGGLVELQFPNHKWRTFGITCFHSVYAPEKNRQILNQVQGAGKGQYIAPGNDIVIDRYYSFPSVAAASGLPGDRMAQHLLRVDHPSLSDLRGAVESKARGIAALKDNEFREIEQQLRARDTDPDDVFVDPKDETNHKATLRTINALEQQHQFFQSYIQDQTYLLGSVFAGSGYWRTRARQDQRKDPTITDWALIEIPKERLGENIPYPYSRSQKPGLKFRDGGYLEHGKSYSKAGRSSGFTMGNKYDETRTMEHVLFKSESNIIAEPGDSGSLVYDAETGRVVGLHIAGAKGTNRAYFTSIHDVYRDIMEVTGAINVRMA
ncbi:hypothetical protein N7468_006855 [Penicillium chermesinum]|uniref:Serine protease n=1 Tax=Penicillium chermesinum TaxID=63820 RepID=A0A9W9NSZ6_9EURO|nr:uncharacterized protein N7468_006855 [Penicillium chermesinum]KAJ5225630.1 hypothetical protein N7468_006855 [Penicillium chermesinum]